MSERTEALKAEALKALEQVFSSTLATLPDEFDSHEFFLALAHQHQQLYIQALVAFSKSVYPFKALHGPLAKRLGATGLVEEIGKQDSPDIFLQKNSATIWRKL